MKVLMFGWEFPPFNSGGLGTACYWLTKKLSEKNVEVLLVLPHPCDVDFAKVVSPFKNLKLIKMNFFLKPYVTSISYREEIKKRKSPVYSGSLFEEVERYGISARNIAENEIFDVIHAHDWLTIPAGIEAKRVSKKPLVLHIHSTEFDRTGGNNMNTHVYEIEKRGMREADLIIAVSNYTKEKIIRYYGIDSNKIIVVHNSVDPSSPEEFQFSDFKKNNKIVLFVGRITLQKGPDYFIYTAKRVLDFYPNVRFLIVGEGDMKSFIMNKVAEMGIADKVLFAGFLRGKDLEKIYKMADLYMMPSVSEPFGITALESIANKTPILISKQSGVSEVITHCLKTDFWDIDDMANKIVNVLKYHELRECLSEHSAHEIKKFSWDEAADKCIEVYNRVSGVY
ncbi:MAG: glycosyltransferase family 4 protein [archaeon]